MRRGTSPYVTLALITALNILNYLDRNVITILAEAIKQDLGISDSKLGFLYGTTFAVFFAMFGMPLGRVADAWRRNWLLAIGVGFWSAMTAASAFAQNFGALAAARFGVGIGEATAAPCAQTLITDLFPRGRRALPVSIFVSAFSVGAAGALVIGGLILDHWSGVCGSMGLCGLKAWQAVFLAVGLPGIFLALVVARLREPVRGGLDGFSYERTNEPLRIFAREMAAVLPVVCLPGLRRLGGGRAVGRNLALGVAIAAIAVGLIALTGDVAQFAALALGFYALGSWFQSISLRDPAFFRLTLGSPAYVVGLGGMTIYACISAAVSFWAVPYAIRTFGIGAGDAGLLFGGLLAVTSLGGLAVTGWLADAWRRRDARAPYWLTACCLVITAPVVWTMFLTDRLEVFVVAYAIYGAVAWSWGGAASTLAQELVLPNMRGSSASAYTLGALLIQLAVGPYVAGKVSDMTGSLSSGVLGLYVLAPFALLAIWIGARSLGRAEGVLAEMEDAVKIGAAKPEESL